MTDLRSVTCHMGSHSVTCYPTQVNAPRHNPSQPGRYSIYRPWRMEGWVDLGSPLAAWPGIEPTTAWSQVRRPNGYATEPPLWTGPRLLLMTNRKSHTRFHLVPNQRPWMTLKGHYELCFKTRASFGAHHENLNEGRPILTATKM